MPFDIAAVLDTGPGWNKVRLTSGEIVTLDGDYNWRSNNPGNIEYGPFTRSHGAIGVGAVPPKRDRGFAIFPDYETGHKARLALQFESPRYRDLTILKAMEQYAPASDNNDPKAYAQRVAAAAGVPVTTLMRDLTPEQQEAFFAAQNQVEGMVPGDVYNEEGIKLPPADLNPRAPSLLPNEPLVPGSYPGPNTRRLPPLGPSAGPPAQLVQRDTPVVRRQLPAIPPSTLGAPGPLTSLSVGGRQPIGMVAPGNLDLNSRRVLTDGVGGFRTENSISIGTDRGEVLIPTVVNGKQLSEKSAIEHYQKTGENLGTFQTPEAADRYAETLHQRQAQQYGNALPKSVPQSVIDRGSSRVALPKVPGRSAGDSLALNPVRQPAPAMDASYDREQGVMRLPPSPIGDMPTLAGTRSAFGLPALPSPPISSPPAQRPRVTVSTPYTTPQSTIERGAPRTVAQLPSVPPPAPRAALPLPPLRAPLSPVVAPAAPVIATAPSNLETARNEQGLMRTRAPLPQPPAAIPGTGIVQSPALAPVSAVRPALTIPAIAPMPQRMPPIAVQPRVAPVPMPRLDRGGLFGKPQILGHDIPLPGIFGVIQNATKAMNNASGPFNNGADNALYNGLRGGDFNTPGAATAQAGGYLFAPKPGGGFINVGRVNPAMSAAALYDSRTARNPVTADAAFRVNGRNGGGGGPVSGADSMR